MDSIHTGARNFKGSVCGFPPVAGCGLWSFLCAGTTSGRIHCWITEELKLMEKPSSKEIKDAREDLEVMARRVETFASLVQRYEGRINDEEIRDRLDGMTAYVFPVIPYVCTFALIHVKLVR